MQNKIKINLGRVQETLLLPLAARAKEAKYRHPILIDTKAIELMNMLDVDRKKLLANMTRIGIHGLAYRAKLMDDSIMQFLEKHPVGKILDIGCGLDTTFYRCDNGKASWYDLDLPDSIALREQLLPIPDCRVKYIAKSMLDYSWMDDIGDISKGLFITIPGVLPYFEEEDVKAFLVTIAQRLKGAEIMFDVISNLGKFFVDRRIKSAGMKQAHLEWAVLKIEDVSNWSPHIEVVKAHNFFDNINTSTYPFYLRNAMRINQFMDMTQIFHLKFI